MKVSGLKTQHNNPNHGLKPELFLIRVQHSNNHWITTFLLQHFAVLMSYM